MDTWLFGKVMTLSQSNVWAKENFQKVSNQEATYLYSEIVQCKAGVQTGFWVGREAHGVPPHY